MLKILEDHIGTAVDVLIIELTIGLSGGQSDRVNTFVLSDVRSRVRSEKVERVGFCPTQRRIHPRAIDRHADGRWTQFRTVRRTFLLNEHFNGRRTMMH